MNAEQLEMQQRTPVFVYGQVSVKNGEAENLAFALLREFSGTEFIGEPYWKDKTERWLPFSNKEWLALLGRLIAARIVIGGRTWTLDWRLESGQFGPYIAAIVKQEWGA